MGFAPEVNGVNSEHYQRTVGGFCREARILFLKGSGLRFRNSPKRRLALLAAKWINRTACVS